MIRSLELSRDWRREAFDRLRADVRDAVEARRNWWDDYKRAYRTYRTIPHKQKSWPWPNCSNLVPPMTTQACEQEIRRLVMYFVQDRQYVTLSALRQGVETLGRAQKTQHLLRWQAESELGYLNFVDSFVREFVIGGTAFGFTGWCFEERPVADALVMGRERLVQGQGGLPEYQMVGEPVDRRTPRERIFDELFGSLRFRRGAYRAMPSPKGVELFEVMYRDEKDRRKTAQVQIDRSEDLGNEIQVVAYMERTLKNQPVSMVRTAEDVIVPPGDHDIDGADFYAVKDWVSWEQIQEHWRKKEWHSDDDEKARLRAVFEDDRGDLKHDPRAGGDEPGFHEETEARDEQDTYVGVDSTRFRSRKVPVLRIVRRWDVNEKGAKRRWHKDPECCITILPKHSMVVRVQFDTADNRAGMRNVVSHHFVKARNEFYGIGYPRMLEAYQEELNAATNMQIDAANLTSMPVIFVDHTAVFERDNLRYYPGSVVRVNQPRENVLFPQWPSRLGEFEVQIQRLQAYGQDLTAQGPTSVGRDPGVSNANRTARGLQALISERNSNVFYDASMLGVPIVRYWKQVHAWDAALMPPKKEIAIAGTDEVAQFETIRRDDVRGEYDFRFEAGQAVLNDEVRRQLFTEAFQLTAPIAQAPPEQVPRPLWNMAREIWIQRGVRDPERFLPQPIDAFGDPLSPAVEHEIFSMGRPVAVHQLDNDALHLHAHMTFAATDSFGRLPKSIIEAFNQHVLLHQRRMNAAQGAGAGRVGNTGAVLGGRLALQGNAAVNSSPGQPATLQPNGVQLPLGPVNIGV